jgi:predicted MPP superfamily phosphohydrolase
MANRRTFLKWLAALPASVAAGGAYATVVEPGFLLVRQTWRPEPATWPSDLRLRIVALADIHMGPPLMTLERLQGIVHEAMELKPDLVVLLGDYAGSQRFFVSHRVTPADTAAVLSGLQAPLGVLSVMGNHDWADDRQAQRRRAGPTFWHTAFEDAGIPVLENSAVRLSWNGKPIWIAGLGSQWAYAGGADDLEEALSPLASDDAPAILLAHEPDIFTRVPSRVSLTLCGHTHGGQVRVLGYSPIVPSRYGNRFAYGHVIENDRHLVVSGGLGCSLLPIRFGVPPEITVIKLGAPSDGEVGAIS